MEHVCPVCEQGFAPDELRPHYMEICATEEDLFKGVTKIHCFYPGIASKDLVKPPVCVHVCLSACVHPKHLWGYFVDTITHCTV